MVKRIITVFLKDSNDESLQHEYPLNNVAIGELQKIFGVSSDNPMYDCFPIDQAKSIFFSDKFGIQFDFEKYEYFVEAEE